jgi:GntR family transcriptional regulator
MASLSSKPSRRVRLEPEAAPSGTDVVPPGALSEVASAGPSKLQRASPIPLYIQIEEELRALIASQQLPPYGQVPSEAELSERFGVSRMTARKALDRLVGDGVLFRQPGKGTFVAPPKIAHGPSQQLSFSSAMRALGLRHETRVLEAGMVPAPSPIGLALNLPFGSPAVFMRRLRIVEGIPAALHISYLPPRFAKLLERDLTGSLYELMANLGARVEQARDSLEAVLATGEEARLLGVQPGAPLVRIQGIGYSGTMEPLRYTEALYRGDRFRFGVDTTRPADLRVELKERLPGERTATML